MSNKSLVLGLAVAVSLGSAAKASVILNGSLETVGTSDGVNLSQASGQNLTIPNWSVHGVAGAGFNAVYDYGVVAGPLPAYMPASYNSCTVLLGFVGGNSCTNPDGTGHFVNLDGDPSFPAAISQTIPVGTNPLVALVLGQQYALTFSWAAVQRNDQFGPTTESLSVSLGSNLLFSPSSTSLPAGGFSGWFTKTVNFTYNGLGTTPNVLTFLASGTPSGLPPSINLDGISLNAVPEPASWGLVITGCGLLFFAHRRRKTAVD